LREIRKEITRIQIANYFFFSLSLSLFFVVVVVVGFKYMFVKNLEKKAKKSIRNINIF